MQTRTEIKVQRAALIISVALMIVKFIAWYFTLSNAILTDALESIINVVAGSFALYAVMLSAKPSDNDHPYGHGKVEFIVSGIEGGMIALAGIMMIGKSGLAFISPDEIQNVSLGLVLTAITGAINYATAWWLISTGKKHHSLPLIADGEHIKSDAYTSFAVIVGLALVWLTGWIMIDNVMAMAMGFWIMYIGYKLIRKALAGIMDEADMHLVKEVVEVLNQNRKSQWIDIHNLRIIQYGSRLHIDCHITFPFYFNLEQIHKEMKEVEVLLNTKYGKEVELFIHPDPCKPISCKICNLKHCEERKFPFERRIEWNYKNATGTKRHEL